MTNWLRALLLLSALGLSACGGGGGGGGGGAAPASVNTAPTANFAVSCVDLACTFTSTSTDQDVGDTIATYLWNFGDGLRWSRPPIRPHLRLRPAPTPSRWAWPTWPGATGTVSRTVAVTAPPVPAAPHASFTSSCTSLDCTFTDTSTFDAGSAFQSRVWDFGDGTTLPATNPANHHYAVTALTTFTVQAHRDRRGRQDQLEHADRSSSRRRRQRWPAPAATAPSRSLRHRA